MPPADQWTVELALDAPTLWTALVGGVLLVMLSVFTVHTLKRSDEFKRRAFEALARSRESEERYRTLVETIPHGIEEIDTSGRILFSNEAHHRMLGYAPNELAGKYIWELGADAEYEKSRLPQLLRTMATERPAPTPYISQDRTKDGRVLDTQVDWNYKLDADGNVTGFISVITDITERLRAEQALRQGESQFRAIFEGSAIGIALGASDGRIIRVNGAFARLLGYAPEELTGSIFTEITHPDDIETDMALFRELMSDRRDSYKIEKRYVRKDGGHVHVQLTVSIFPGGCDNARLAIAMVEDISERKRMEQALLSSERLSTLGKVTAMVAHDLRNPIFAMRQFLGAMRSDEYRGNGRLMSVADGIEQCIGECGHIIDDLLNFTRMDAVRLQDVTVDKLVAETLDRRHAPPGTVVKSRLGLGETSAQLDPGQFRRAFHNVMDNAIQAIAGPGDSRTASQVEVTTRKKNGRLEVAVRDTGSGIAEDAMPYVFDPLYSTRTDGYGLGLPCVRKIMEEHAGGVEISSRPGIGTEVVLWLPHVTTAGAG